MADESVPSERRVSALRLALTSGIGPRLYQSLVEYFGSPEAADRAAPSQLRAVPGIGPKLVRTLVSARSEIDVGATMELCRKNSIKVIITGDEAYPRLLQEIPTPPLALFVRGTLLPTDAISIAIVGTRHATIYGTRQAERLAQELARAGLTIVSGLARGIDAAAHRGAMLAGGRTIAVLGSGVLNVYPPEHRELAAEITKHGAVISEAHPDSNPHSGTFPQRNRLISGLSLGVIVVEAANRSGALISATHAAEQGREVFAVPGPIDSRASRGCHQLLRDGAKLVESADDVLTELGPLVESLPQPAGRTMRHPAELQLNEQETAVLDAIEATPTSMDDIAARSRVPIHRVLSTISVLEMRRLIRRVSGTMVVRN